MQNKIYNTPFYESCDSCMYHLRRQSPTQTKRGQPMEVNNSTQSGKVIYMNRSQSNAAAKRTNDLLNLLRKQQKLFATNNFEEQDQETEFIENDF